MQWSSCAFTVRLQCSARASAKKLRYVTFKEKRRGTDRSFKKKEKKNKREAKRVHPTLPSSLFRLYAQCNSENNSDMRCVHLFDLGFEVEGILGAIITKDGKITMGIKYKDSEQTEWLPSSFVNKHFEQLTIKFYEETFDCRTNSFPTINCHFGKYLMRRIPPNLLSDDEKDLH